MKKGKGSAILIAVFLVTAVGSVAFGIGKLFLVESNLSNVWENSTIAYYAAESGIEEGLLRYKYDKNQEKSPGSKNVLVANLSKETIADELWNPLFYINNFDAADKHYSSTIEYLQRYYGEDIDMNGSFMPIDVINNNSTDYFIPRDQSMKLDLTKLNSSHSDIKLWVIFTEDDTTSGVCDYDHINPVFMEVKLTGSTPVSNLNQSSVALVHHVHQYNLSADTFLSGPVNNGVIEFSSLISNIGQLTNSAIYDHNQALEMSLKPIGCSAKIGITATNSVGSKLLPGPYNTIKSTGYYGGGTRTIEVKVDRQSGTVYDLYDYVLYNR